jgi:uncharacterized membrane protein YkoI
MTGRKLIVILAALTAVICLSIWGVITVNAAGGPSQPRQPATAGNAKSDDENGKGEAKDENENGEPKAENEKAENEGSEAKAENESGEAKNQNERGESKNDNENGEARQDGSISPADAQKAKAAALKIAGGGTVQEVEKGDEGNPAWYDVKIQKSDGTEVKVELDGNFRQRQSADESEAGGDQEGPDND